MKRIDGKATPANVPRKNGFSGTSSIGEQRLMNQFGRIGVMRRKIINHNKLSERD